MNDRDALLQLMEQLTEEVQQLHLAQTVQRSAYVVLVRHLSAQGLVRPDTLAQDLETMAESHPEPGWQSGLVDLANALRLVGDLPSAQPKELRRTPRS